MSSFMNKILNNVVKIFIIVRLYYEAAQQYYVLQVLVNKSDHYKCYET